MASAVLPAPATPLYALDANALPTALLGAPAGTQWADAATAVQQAAVGHVAGCGDGRLVLPTGAGKSLVLCAPSMPIGGMTVLLQPAQALLVDQAEAEEALGVASVLLGGAQEDAGAALRALAGAVQSYLTIKKPSH